MSALFQACRGAGAPMVMIPGWAMHRKVWGGWGDALARRYRVCCIELPGHGGTPSRPGWTLPDVAARLAEAIEAPSVLVGWSLGGQVALQVASSYPEKVAGLVLIGTNPKFTVEGGWPGMVVETLRRFREGVETDVTATLNRFLSLVCQGGDGRGLRLLRRNWRALPPPSLEDLLQGLRLLEEVDLRPVLTGIGVPALVVAGEGDVLVPLEASRRLAAMLPDGRLLTLEGGGHAPFLFHPEALQSAVAGCFAGADLARGQPSR